MTVEPVVLVSALEHHLYCPRQCALIHVDGIWADNRATVAGSRAHRRVDTPGSRQERGRTVARALPLHSERYGLSGRSDGDREEVECGHCSKSYWVEVAFTIQFHTAETKEEL